MNRHLIIGSLLFLFFIFHFTNDMVKNKNILTVQKIEKEYIYIGKSKEDLENYYYLRNNNNNLVENFYIDPKLDINLIIDENITVYKVFYDFNNSNFLYKWLYEKLLLENEFGNYDIIYFKNPLEKTGE